MGGSLPHPLQHLSKDETILARDIIKRSHPDTVIEFREIGLKEPDKAELLPFLELEHSGTLCSSTPRPTRLAKCHYDTIGSDRLPRYNEAIVNLDQSIRLEHRVIDQDVSPALTMSVYLLSYIINPPRSADTSLAESSRKS